MKFYICDIKMKNYKSLLKKVISQSDIITLHIPSKQNFKFFGKTIEKLIKKPFFLINTSRGDVVDEKMIIKFLKSGKMLGYATDVLYQEFLPKFKLKENIIFKNRRNYNIIITPHIGGSTKDAWKLTEFQVIKK